jgi:predicted nucleic acid-binding protein
MELIETAAIDDGALLLIDTAPIVYILERHPRLAPRFEPLFERHARGEVLFAVTTIGIAEVLTGPIGSGDEILTRRYRTLLETWQVVDLTVDVAETAARLRAAYRLRLPDAIQAASAIEIGASALVTHDRDFSKLSSLRVLG